MIKTITDKVGVTGVIVIAIILILYTIAIFKKKVRETDPQYIKGISLGLNKGVKGNIVLDYEFTVNGVKYKGFVPGSFCDKCPQCCSKGDSVLVKYESGNPNNNALVVHLPTDK